MEEQAQVTESGPQVIETASGTTSPDNANSGAKPLVIAGLGLLLAILVFSYLGGCAAQVVGDVLDREFRAFDQMKGSGGNAWETDEDDEELVRELEELLRDDQDLGSSSIQRG
ncbi:hypothetical protein [Olsenella phocaeensis]|uniref:hypothetical protein n=1 Tax=Olsenella phocaeensis TaxID=1852385 RepID=UPI003A940937